MKNITFIFAVLIAQNLWAQEAATTSTGIKNSADSSESSVSTLPMPQSPTSSTTSPVMTEVASKKEEPKEEPLQFFGDFRYRQQSETQEPKQERRMQRIQARFGVSSQVLENLKLTLRLMTGSAANSGNQTLGDEKAPGMPRRTFGLDQAYFDYKPISSLNIYGGKMPQPFIFAGKNQMLLDRDITLEGLGLKFLGAATDEIDLFAQGGSFWIRENYDSQFGESQTPNLLNAVQLGLQWKPKDWLVTIGVGSFSYTDLKDNPPGNFTTGANGNGNTLDINGNYPTNFDIEQFLLEVKRKVWAVEVTLFYEALKNKDADQLNKATSYGILATYKSWGFGWTQQEVQKDSVLGLFTDSDFGGGLTSSRGYVWNISYKLAKKVQIQYTVFKNQNSIDTVALNYDRSHIDLIINF